MDVNNRNKFIVYCVLTGLLYLYQFIGVSDLNKFALTHVSMRNKIKTKACLFQQCTLCWV